MAIWTTFLLLITGLLIIDLGLFNRRNHEITLKENLFFTAFYIFTAILFGVWIRYALGAQFMNEYYTGYLVEQSLSLDNLFVMSLIFKYLSIPGKYQRRVLFWGIIGVIVFRAGMIAAGSALIHRFEGMLYAFSLILAAMGIKMLFIKNAQTDISRNPILEFLRRRSYISENIKNDRFFVLSPEGWRITPLLAALILIETADIVFALDSIPAVFAITQNTYIVYASNIFAILGLRSMYFCLEALMARFIYLQTALAAVLIFIGSKIFIAPLLGMEKFPARLSLSVTVILLALGVIYSLWKTRKHG